MESKIILNWIYYITNQIHIYHYFYYQHKCGINIWTETQIIFDFGSNLYINPNRRSNLKFNAD
jgi:hypothetical protein